MSEIITRSDGVLTRSDGVLENVDFKHRLIDVIAVPWDQPARVLWRGDYWTEWFERGAFDTVGERAGKIRVNREHRKGDTVGKVIEFGPGHERGLFSRVKVVKGTKGDELLHLADEDMVSASIGYRANKLGHDVAIDKEQKTRRVRHALLDHLGMVEDPAFEGAQVLAVREGVSGLVADQGPLPDTPVLDEMLRDPVIAWVMQQKGA